MSQKEVTKLIDCTTILEECPLYENTKNELEKSDSIALKGQNKPHLNINFEFIFSKVESLMQKETFKDADLTLDKLAAQIGTSRHHLSATFNQYIGKSFYLFINEYRIEKVKALLNEAQLSKERVNLLAIAFEAGFHSKSSFNQYFKKIVGCTPSSYIEQVINEKIYSYSKKDIIYVS